MPVMTPPWTLEQETAIHRHMVGDITLKPTHAKCRTCLTIYSLEDLDEGRCPTCGPAGDISTMCPVDHGRCHHDISGGVEYCPICEAPICPQCGSHDVMQVSRVTGYLGDVSGWAEHKKRELKDRMRYDPITGEQLGGIT
jgi:hypothetical protein